jgi:hypothetical protein
VEVGDRPRGRATDVPHAAIEEQTLEAQACILAILGRLTVVPSSRSRMARAHDGSPGLLRRQRGLIGSRMSRTVLHVLRGHGMPLSSEIGWNDISIAGNRSSLAGDG